MLFISSQMKFNAEVGRHDHYDPFSILMGLCLQMELILAVNGGKILFRLQTLCCAFTISTLEGKATIKYYKHYAKIEPTTI